MDSIWLHGAYQDYKTIKWQAFASLLNNIHTDRLEPNLVKDHILQSTEISFPEVDPAYPHAVMHIYVGNKYAAERNEKMLNRFSGHLYTFTAKDTIKGQNTKLFHHYNARSI